MRSAHRLPTSSRPGLTLVELIVVIAIIAFLAGLAALLFPRLQDSQRTAKGADIVQGNLFVAKQMALRDQLARGVRLVSSTGSATGPFDQLQLIEQPTPYTTGVAFNPINGPNATWQPDPNTGWFIVQFLPDPVTGAAPNFGTGAVLPGDLLDLSGGNDQYTATTPPTPGMMHLIMSVDPAQSRVFVLTQPVISYNGVPAPFNNIYYRIIRSPRPLTGQAPVSLPNNIVVDASNASGGGSLIPLDTDGKCEILFDPSGKVLRASGSQGKVVLWVKDVTPAAQNSMNADQTLIAVYTRNGLITAQPVDLSSGNPYSFIQDGSTSGM
jgi:prepilin-type N-terminal cleavage/methylation domain-containing protein